MLEPVADAKVVLPPGFRVRSWKGEYLQAKPGFSGIFDLAGPPEHDEGHANEF
jgi:hypothetical protein